MSRSQWEYSSKGIGRKILEKYGYSDGKGLGRNEDGIPTPIEPAIKHDKFGIDYMKSSNNKRRFEHKFTNEESIPTVELPEIEDVSALVDTEERTIHIEKNTLEREEICEVSPETIAMWNEMYDQKCSQEQQEQIDRLTASIQSLLKQLSNMIPSQSDHSSPRSEEVELFSFEFPSQFRSLSQYDAELLQDNISHIFQLLDSATKSTFILPFDQIVELAQTLQFNYADQYEDLQLETAIFLLGYLSISKQLENWNFSTWWKHHPLPDDDSLRQHTYQILVEEQNQYVKQYVTWKDFMSDRVSFATHHLWNQITYQVRSILQDFIQPFLHETELSVLGTFRYERRLDSLFLLRVLTLWIEALPSLDAMIEDCLLPELLYQTQQNEELATLHEWLPLWVHFFGADASESILVVVYRKFSTLLETAFWTIFDLSVLLTLLHWKRVIFPFLMDKLLSIHVLPRLTEVLEYTPINLPPESRRSFWYVLQWFELFLGNEDFEILFIEMLENSFFPRWLNTLYLWLDSPSFSYSDCMNWYQCWKNLFNCSIPVLYSLIYPHFHHALEIVNTHMYLEESKKLG